jgi:IS4 transposase
LDLVATLGSGRVELFFKWIKQNLRIKHFFGTTDNAVKTQVWIAICVYVQVAILRVTDLIGVIKLAELGS